MEYDRLQYDQSKNEYDIERNQEIEAANQLTAVKDEYCDWEKNPVGYKFSVRVRGSDTSIEMNKTERFLHLLERFNHLIWGNILDPSKVDRETCEAEDCFHRCYGTAQTSYCAECQHQIFRNAFKLNSPRVQVTLKEACSKCQVTPEEDPAISPEFPQY